MRDNHECHAHQQLHLSANSVLAIVGQELGTSFFPGFTEPIAAGLLAVALW